MSLIIYFYINPNYDTIKWNYSSFINTWKNSKKKREFKNYLFKILGGVVTSFELVFFHLQMLMEVIFLYVILSVYTSQYIG
jgi:hypothetical protein